MQFKSLMLIFLLYFSCGLEVDKLDPDLLPLSCTNGAINPPVCDEFSPCTNGATNPPACDEFPPCTNGATNPPACDICPTGQIIYEGVCRVPCDNEAINPPACDICPAGYTMVGDTCRAPCDNGATNPPACDTCPAGKTMVGTECVNNCTNGAINPPSCNQCQAPKTWDGEKCVSPTKCTPAGTKIKWDTYSDSSILGFKVYLGIDDKNYSVVKSVMPWSATEALLAGLDITLNPCLANYIYVTAYKSTIESDPSNKVCWGEACD